MTKINNTAPGDNDEELKIIVRNNPRAIQVGNCFFNIPDLKRYAENRYTRKEVIFKANLIEIEFDKNLPWQSLPKAQNKMYARRLGSRFNERFQKVSYALWVGDDWRLIHRFCRIGKGLSSDLVFRFHHFRDFVDLALANKERQLIPALLYFGKPVGELKQGLGSGIWKSLCNNSVSRNIAIFKIVGTFKSGQIDDSRCTPEYPQITCVNMNAVKAVLSRLINLPSGILNSHVFYNELAGGYDMLPDADELFWSEEANVTRDQLFLIQLTIFETIARDAQINQKITDQVYLRESHRVFIDTLRLACQLKESFNYAWSLGRVHREHRRLTKLLRARKLQEYSKYPYQFSKPWLHSLSHKDIDIVLLKSPYDIALEGHEMNHCVASYHHLVFHEKSLIFSLRNTSGYRSTLQLAFETSKRLGIVQHRSVNDDDITETAFHHAAEYVLERQNQVLKNAVKDKQREEFFVMTFCS